MFSKGYLEIEKKVVGLKAKTVDESGYLGR